MSFQILKHSELLLYLFWTINNSLLERKKNTNKIQFNYLKTKHLVLGKLDLKEKKSKIFWLKPSEEFCWKAKRSHFFLIWSFLNCVSAVPLKCGPQSNMLYVKHSSELSALPCWPSPPHMGSHCPNSCLVSATADKFNEMGHSQW